MFLETIIHFNIAALFIFGITIFYIVYRKSYKAYSSLMFLIINIMYFLVGVIDIFVSTDLLNLTANKIFMFVYYFMKYQTSVCFLIYIILITNSQDIIRKNKRTRILFSIPFVLTVGFLIANIFTGQIYYYDGDVYKRGDLIFLFYGLTFIYVVVGIIWLEKYRKTFSFSEMFSLFSVYGFSIVALILQYFYPDALIELLSTSIAFLLLSCTVERSQMIVDPKTGLKNRMIFDRMIYPCFKRGKENGLVLFYIKNYSLLYDRFTYDIAIKNIRTMAGYLDRAFILELKYSCFYLGNGLIAILTDGIEDANILVNKIEENLNDSENKNLYFNVDYRMFVSKIPTDFNSKEEFNQFASNFGDYLGKGKKVFRINDVKDDKDHKIFLKLDEILNNVVENKKIDIEFQPIYQLSEKKYTAVETLARIIDPDYGLITADIFIPYAEKKDIIYDIDMAIIDKVHGLYKKLNFESLGIKYVAINLSIHTVCNQKFVSGLKEIEKKYGVDKSKVYYEIKERENSTFEEYALNTIKSLMDEGYLFSLDNYGIGCMPVDDLAKVPFVNVKFDNIFARNCDKEETIVIIDNTIKLFKNLDKVSMCAGVEDEDSAKKLEALNPDYIQGYYYSKPLSLNELIKFINLHNQKQVS